MATEPALNWDRLLETVRDHEPELYRSWFATLYAAQPERGELEIRADDLAQVHYLEDYCRDAFTRAAMKVTGRLVGVRFACSQKPAQHVIAAAQPPALTQVRLVADYTFEQFVVGPSNRLAQAACGAVCDQLGTLYNPLFIHGASGLGKTHLLQATCAQVLRHQPSSHVVYVTCETFVNDFVQAIAAGQLPQFRESARQTDLLVIDDVQFLANRESSQEELFHTFNVLYQAGRQIILSADKAPAAIPTLEDRLVSRFNWGLVVQIDPPNRETRQAILHKKARLRGVAVPDEVVDLIAEHVQPNIRLLEGALTKLITSTQLEGKPLNVETAREVLTSYVGREPRPLRVADILETVATHFGLRVQELLGRKRSRSISYPRQVAMYLARKLTPLSLEEIGAHFGGRDHSTVLHAERSIETERAHDRELANHLTQLTTRLLSRN
jgi:chromosomal replication initiator protein